MSTLKTKTICGVQFPDSWLDVHCLLWLFHFGNKLAADPFWRPEGTLDGNPSKIPYNGTGRFEHAKQLGQMLWPKAMQWHDFSEKAVQAFCENDWTIITGCGGSSKSTSAGFYALLFIMCAPADSAVLIASTTLDGAKRRIWKEVSRFYTTLVRLTGSIGEMVMIGNPKPCIRSSQKDTAHGIFVIAVAAGELQKGIENLKGYHPKRLLVIADELDSINMAVVDVCANLRIGTLEFQFIGLGNDPSLLSPLGILMEPEDGSTIDLSKNEWMSKRHCKCLRFDGYDSPNIKGKGKFSGIMDQSSVDDIIRRYGDNSPQAWTMIRGLHPPTGVENTILSEQILVRYNTRDSVVWHGQVTSSALLDPAFGGDRCVIRKMDRGMDTDGKMRLLFHEPIMLHIQADDKINPPEYQIAHQAMTFCKANSIPPNEFILDATGTGRGTAAVIQREWSPSIVVCEFGGAPSDMIVSEENPKPAKEEYERRIAELYFSFREFCQADLIRGLDNDTAKEFCQRKFEIKNKKIAVQSKRDLKADGYPSPDLSDNAVLGVELARQKGVYASIKTDVKSKSSQELSNYLRKADIDADEGSLYQDETLEAEYAEY